MIRKLLVISVVLLILLSVVGCGVPKKDYDAVQSENVKLTSEVSALRIKYDDLKTERIVMAAENLTGFKSVSEFVSWIKKHTQPETDNLEDAFLAANYVQEEAIKDGYLVGLCLDVYSLLSVNKSLIGVTAFVDNELYFWFVEDATMYYRLGLKR